MLGALVMVLHLTGVEGVLYASISLISEQCDHVAVTANLPSLTQNADPCSCFHAFVQYHTLADADIHISPTGLLHAGNVTSKSVQTELELYTMISMHAIASDNQTATHSCHAEVSQHTSSLCAHDTAVPDLCWTGVAVHLAELKLRLRARTLGQRGVTDNVAKSLSV